MKSKFLFSAILAVGLMFVNFSVSQVYGQTTPSKTVKPQNVQYTCPMHPEVVQNNPGSCPKCGTKLVEKKELMPKGDVPQSNDSTLLKKDNTQMKKDTTTMVKSPIMNDTTSMNTDRKVK